MTDPLKTTKTTMHQVCTSILILKLGGLYERIMPLRVPVCGLSLVPISEKKADYENSLLITIALI